MIRSYNKVHVSNRTKKMLSVVWNFQMKTLLKGKKKFLEMFQFTEEEAIIQKYWPLQAEWQQQHVMVIKNDVALKLLFWVAY